jgi:gamma-glutamyltranspeptidase/glutathione hydrolase
MPPSISLSARDVQIDPGGKVVDDETVVGHKAVGIPGTLAGLTMALNQYGTMSLKDVMAPSIQLAEEGYEVSRTLNGLMKEIRVCHGIKECPAWSYKRICRKI